jgi:dTMP kinase
LITFEGLDGCGKTTQITLAAEHLRAQGMRVVETKEPGGTPLGQQLRDILMNAAPGTLSPLTELVLMFAARAQHIEQVILPALRGGAIVLCDRFTDSSLAYQGYGHGVPLETIRTLEDLLCQGVRPHLTLLLDVDIQTSASRTRARNHVAQQAASRFEQEGHPFFERVRAGYQEIACQEPQRVAVIDGSASLHDVHRAVLQVIERFLSRGDRLGL